MQQPKTGRKHEPHTSHTYIRKCTGRPLSPDTAIPRTGKTAVPALTVFITCHSSGRLLCSSKVLLSVTYMPTPCSSAGTSRKPALLAVPRISNQRQGLELPHFPRRFSIRIPFTPVGYSKYPRCWGLLHRTISTRNLRQNRGKTIKDRTTAVNSQRQQLRVVFPNYPTVRGVPYRTARDRTDLPDRGKHAAVFEILGAKSSRKESLPDSSSSSSSSSLSESTSAYTTYHKTMKRSGKYVVGEQHKIK